MLQHPVTRELVSYKWKAYAMPVFVINLVIYLAFVAFLTAYAIFIPLPNESSCRVDDDCSTGMLVNKYIHAYIYTCKHAYMHTYIRTFRIINVCMHPLIVYSNFI